MESNQSKVNHTMELSQIQCARSSRQILLFVHEHRFAESKVSLDALVNLVEGN